MTPSLWHSIRAKTAGRQRLSRRETKRRGPKIDGDGDAVFGAPAGRDGQPARLVWGLPDGVSRRVTDLDSLPAGGDSGAGAFASQAGASNYVGKMAGQARSSAAGLYVALYYLGGCAGSILPGLFWKQAGWLGCAALMIFMQALVALIAGRVWEDKSSPVLQAAIFPRS